MTQKLKTAIYFGVGMTFVFCATSFVSIIKGEDETASEVLRSFGAALGAGLLCSIVVYFLYDKLKLERMLGGNKDDKKG